MMTTPSAMPPGELQWLRPKPSSLKLDFADTHTNQQQTQAPSSPENFQSRQPEEVPFKDRVIGKSVDVLL